MGSNSGVININLTKDAVKITGVSFSYNKAIENELNFGSTMGEVPLVM